MANRFKVLGINDDKSFCECCGKDGLQRVVWIEDTETGEIKHFGTTCAASPKKGFDLKEEIKQEIRRFDYAQKAILSWAWNLYRKVYNGPIENMTEPSKLGFGVVIVGARATDIALYNRCKTEAATKSAAMAAYARRKTEARAA